MNAEPLNILQLASHTGLNRGGAVQMIRLARGLAERGHRVTAVFNTGPGVLPEGEAVRRATAAGVVVTGIDLAATDARERLRRLWRDGAFSVLHAHREDALLAAAATLTDERVPCFIAQRGTIYLPDWFSPEHRLLFSRRIDRIVAVSRAVRRALIRRRLIPPRKIEVIYGGVESELFHPGVDGRMQRLRRRVPPGSIIVTLPGALIEKKGAEYFVRAAALLRRQRQGVRYWIVGQGKLEERLRALAEELELGPQIEFLGHVDAMPEIYAASDLIVCAAIKGEGLTGTLREALAMARPVVTTDCAGNTELVEEGVTGFVSRPADPLSLAHAMLRALNDPDRATRLAEAGRERVLAWCDEHVRSEKADALYRAVLQTKLH